MRIGKFGARAGTDRYVRHKSDERIR